MNLKKIVTVLAVSVFALPLAACNEAGVSSEQARAAVQAKKTQGMTLEKANLAEKRKREENPSAIGYVYLVSFGKPFGYYVTKGKISASGSQATPGQQIVYACASSAPCQALAMDGAQDDGSYGQGDPGIFFFTADGTKVVTSLDYIQSDKPLAIDVPLLGGK
jgi:hypothetical protein